MQGVHTYLHTCIHTYILACILTYILCLHTCICVAYFTSQRIQSFYSVATWVRKTMDSSEEKGLFITQSSTKGDISAEIEGNVL